jgi:flagellar biosynthesis anti-sigma factor FlgM
MKISYNESGKAAKADAHEEKILPKDRPRGLFSSSPDAKKRALSPLEQGMSVAEAALNDVSDVRENLVEELKERINKGEYQVDGKEIADMMLRRLAADRIR